MTLPSYGQPIRGLPTALRFVRDLEAFEGPILSEWRTESGSAYLEKWCAAEGVVARHLLVRADQRSIAEYLAGRISMLTLLTSPSDGVGFIVDRAGDQTVAAFVVSVRDLPVKYLPDATAMHDPALRPDWETTPQHFLVDGEWDAKLLADIERKYQNVYGFNLLFGEDSELSQPSDIFRYIYDAGYPYWRAFNRVRTSVPKSMRARTVGVSVSSPGILTIEAPTEPSRRLLVVLERLRNSVGAYRELHRWSRFRHDEAHLVPPYAREELDALCNHLGIDSRRLFRGPSLDVNEDLSVLVAGKLVASYYRKLWELRDLSGEVEFLGPRIEIGSQPPVVWFGSDEEDDDDEDANW